MNSFQRSFALCAATLALLVAAVSCRKAESIIYYDSGTAKQAKGDLEGAITDFNRAIELDPKRTNAYNNRGLARAAKGDVEGAIADYNHAIELDPKSAFAYAARGDVNALVRNWTEALADYRHFCELSERRQDYPRLYIWLIRTRIGDTEAASKELNAYMGSCRDAAPGDWVGTVAGHLLGSVTEANLFAAAASTDTKKESGQMCEAWFYAGMKKLFAGEKAVAIADLHKCLETEQRAFKEYQLAEAELKALVP
jgi:lipoprotein NlpI